MKIKLIWNRPYNKGWLAIILLLSIGFYYIETSSNFARLGSVVVCIALLVEVLTQRRLSKVKLTLDKSVARLSKHVEMDSRRSNRPPSIDVEGHKMSLDESHYKHESTAHINVLAMGIIGTLVWGYGDCLHEWFFKLSGA